MKRPVPQEMSSSPAKRTTAAPVVARAVGMDMTPYPANITKMPRVTVFWKFHLSAIQPPTMGMK